MFFNTVSLVRMDFLLHTGSFLGDELLRNLQFQYEKKCLVIVLFLTDYSGMFSISFIVKLALHFLYLYGAVPYLGDHLKITFI